MSEQKIYQIEPVPLAIVNGFRIARVEMMLSLDSATIYVDLMDGCVCITQKALLLDGQDYINWGANQPFLNNWICSKLNMTMI